MKAAPRCARPMRELPGSAPFPACGRKAGHSGRCISREVWERQVARKEAVRRGAPLPPKRRPVYRLTFTPARGHLAGVFCQGVQVAEIAGTGMSGSLRWSAVLWPVPGKRPRRNGRDRAVVPADGRGLLRLGDLKAELRIRLGAGGPWWAEPEEEATAA